MDSLTPEDLRSLPPEKLKDLMQSIAIQLHLQGMSRAEIEAYLKDLINKSSDSAK